QTVQGRKKANEARFDQRGPEDGRRRAGCGRTRSGARCPRGEPVPCLPERFQRKDTPVPGRGAPQVHRRSASASGSRPAAGGRGAEGVLPAEPVVAAGAATRLRGGAAPASSGCPAGSLPYPAARIRDGTDRRGQRHASADGDRSPCPAGEKVEAQASCMGGRSSGVGWYG